LNPETSKSIAACFALAGFTVAIVSGLAVDNPGTRIIKCALGALIVCYVTGLVVGAIANKIAADHIASYKTANPIPGAGSAPAQTVLPTGARTP
jgi:hypothetical protein